MPPTSSRKAAIHEDSSSVDHPDPANSSQEWDVREIIDEKGPPGHEGRYLIDWEDSPSGTAFPRSWERKDGCTPALVREWKKKKKADPSIVGRYGGEPEELHLSTKKAGPSTKRSRSRAASSASRQPSSDVDEPDAKKRCSRPSAGPRVRHRWEYVEVSSQEPKPLKISIEAEIRRRKKEGLPPLPLEDTEDEKPNVRATRIRSRDASGSKPPPARTHGGSKAATISPKTESRSGASPRQTKNVPPSTLNQPSPSRRTTSRDKNLPALPKRPPGRPKKTNANASTSRDPSPIKSNSRDAFPAVAGPSKQKRQSAIADRPPIPTQPTDLPAPAEASVSAKSPPQPIAEMRSAPSRLGRVHEISASQFQAMVKPALEAGGPTKPRSPSPSQNDAIAPFSSPVAPSIQGSRAKKQATAQSGGAAGTGLADADQVDSSLEVGEESSSQNSTEEEVQGQIITEMIDGEVVTRVVTEADKAAEKAAPVEDAEASSSQESSEEDISHVQIGMVVVDGEEVTDVRERAEDDAEDGAELPPNGVVDEVINTVEAVAEHMERDTGAEVQGTTIAIEVADAAVEPVIKELPEQPRASETIAVAQTAAVADHGPKVDETLPPSEAIRQAAVSALDHAFDSPVPPTSSVAGQAASLASHDASHDRQIAEQAARIQELEQEVARLQKSYDNSVNDNAFLRRAYQDASNKAVAEVQRNDALEEEMKILRGQLKFGLKQKEMLGAAVEKKRETEMTQLRMQNKVLLNQSRLTDDDVRRRASAYGKMKHERDQLLQKNGELHEKYEALSERNEELVDQVHYFRAKQMGVFGSDSEEDDNEEEWDEEDDVPMLKPGARDRRVDPIGGHGGSSRHSSLPNGSAAHSEHEDVFTASQVVPSDSQFPLSQAQAEEGVYRSGLYWCKWTEPERCTAVFDDFDAFGRHVEAHADAQM